MIHSIPLQIILVALAVTIACIIPGVFLVLRGIALMSDAISHAILPGIVIMFLCIGTIDSLLLIIGASLAGLLTVLSTEALMQTQCIKKDTALGLVYPFFFSIGVLLISACARNVHLDTDMVLLGELAFAPFNQLSLYGYAIGPVALWTMLFVCMCNGLYVYACFKQLVITTFDPIFAYVQHIRPSIYYYGLMTITALTTVTAFDAVGSIVVVALMICPAAVAYVLSDSIVHMMRLALTIGCYGTILGYIFAWYCDVSIAGSIATAHGIVLFVTLLCHREKGIISNIIAHRQRTLEFGVHCVAAYLADCPLQTSSIQNISCTLGWSQTYCNKVIKMAIRQAIISSDYHTAHLNQSH